MEIALRAAMEKSESESAPASSKSKKSKGISNEQEDLLKRTLKNR
jgi:hypothetical protein